MSEFKPTPGEWVLYINTFDDVVVRKMNEAGYEQCVIAQKAKLTDAKLIADAGNTYHATSMTPSQLAGQRDELLEALQSFPGFTDDAAVGDAWIEMMRAAIAKATGQQA